MQSKKESLFEVTINTLIGFFVTLLLAPLVYKVANVEMSYSQMGFSTVLFTLISIIRGYFIRRIFNYNEKRNM